ncbi:hypothetical protein ACFLUO_08950 [Chloroflexota bacterium]
MSYTQLKDERIESKIEQELNIVCEEILKVIKPVSIILFGSYGRGEGSAQIIDDKVIVTKDYDTLLVMNKSISPSVIYRISENIHKRLGRTNPLDSVTMEMDSGVSLLQFTTDELLYFRDAKAYEIKEASKLLWGEDIRDRISLKAEDLSPWNGIRFLLHTSLGLCAAFSTKYLQESPAREDKKTLVHECSRVYLDGSVLLTILAGNYRPTCRERASVIKESLNSSLPKLVAEIPDLVQKVEFFTDLKLFPTEEKYNAMDPVGLWFETRKDLGIIFRYFMEQHLGEKCDGWAVLSEKYNSKMKTRFVDELAYYYLKRRFKIANKSLARLANIAYQRRFCLKYMLKLYKKEGVLLLRALNEFPTFKIGTSGLVLLFSLKEDGTLDKDLFASFVKSLSRIYPVTIKSDTDGEQWQEGVDHSLKASRTFLDTFYGWG